MSDAHDSHRQSVATWVTTGQRRFSTYPPSISVTSPATPGFPEPQIQMQYGNGQHEDDVDGEYPPSGAYGSHQLAAARGYEGVVYDQNQDASRVAGAELEDLDPDVDESFTIGRGTTNGMPTPNIPRSVPLPPSAETSQHGFIPPHPLGPMYTNADTAGSDIHAMDSPAEFAPRLNDFSAPSRLRVQSSGKNGGVGATGRRMRAFARAIGRVLALASPMRIVNAVRRRRKPARRSSPKFPPESILKRRVGDIVPPRPGRDLPSRSPLLLPGEPCGVVTGSGSDPASLIGVSMYTCCPPIPFGNDISCCPPPNGGGCSCACAAACVGDTYATGGRRGLPDPPNINVAVAPGSANR